MGVILNILQLHHKSVLLVANFHIISRPAKLARCDSENTQIKKAAAAAEADAEPSCSKSAPLDPYFAADIESPGGKAYKEFNCMLNQTDVINNNNKFYVIQVAKVKKIFHVFNRWGRVVSTLLSFTKY